MVRVARGQLVLLAAATVAVALAPVVLAYLQLAYAGDVEASGDYDAPAAAAERALERAVHEAGANVTATYGWTDRRQAVDSFDRRLDPRIERLERTRLSEGTAYEIAANASAAREWTRANCPGGPDRQFGPCEAHDGVVVQERAGETHVLAVALDVTVTTDRGSTDLTWVVRTVGGTAATR